MSERRHTPGEWEAWRSPTRQYPDDPQYDEWTVSAGRPARSRKREHGAGVRDIASILQGGDIGPEEAAANAALIAAAPEMAEALERIARMDLLPIGDASEEMSSRLQAARIARETLAKAHGEVVGLRRRPHTARGSDRGREMIEPLRLAWKERPWSQGKWTAVHIVADPPRLPESWMRDKEPAAIRQPLKMLCGVVFPGTDACDNYEVGDFDGLNADCKRCAKKAGVEPREYTG